MWYLWLFHRNNKHGEADAELATGEREAVGHVWYKTGDASAVEPEIVGPGRERSGGDQAVELVDAREVECAGCAGTETSVFRVEPFGEVNVVPGIVRIVRNKIGLVEIEIVIDDIMEFDAVVVCGAIVIGQRLLIDK